MAEGGKVVEINHFGSFKDAKQVFDEIASDHRCEPETVNMTFQYGMTENGHYYAVFNNFKKIFIPL